MITTQYDGTALSSKYGTAVRAASRQWRARLKDANGDEIPCSINRIEIERGSCDTDTFTVGNVCGTSMTAELGDCTATLKDTWVSVEIGLLTDKETDTWEYVQEGVFFITDAEKSDSHATITGHGRVVASSTGEFIVPPTKTLARLKAALSAALGCTVGVESGITQSNEIDIPDGLTTYQAMQIIAACVGGFICDTPSGAVRICRYKRPENATLTVALMHNPPELGDRDFEITGVRCIVAEATEDDEGEIVPAVGYEDGLATNFEMQNEYMTEALFNDFVMPNTAHDITYYTATRQYAPLIIASYHIEAGKTYVVSFDTPNTGQKVYRQPPQSLGFDSLDKYSFICDGTRKSMTGVATATADIRNTVISKSDTTTEESGYLSNLRVDVIDGRRLLGYSYRPGSAELALGDPRLESSDVVNINVGGTVYRMPCHVLRHVYDGGFTTEITAVKGTNEDNSIGTKTPMQRALSTLRSGVAAAKLIAEKAKTIAANTAQYFWLTETGTDTGAHITEIPKEDFLRDPTNGGGNLLARSSGIAVRDGLTELAKFGRDGVVVGIDDSQHSHQVIDYQSMQMIDRNGLVFFRVGDSRNENGIAEVTATFVHTGFVSSGVKCVLPVPAISDDYTVYVDGELGSPNVKTSTYFSWNTHAPQYGQIIEAVYQTTEPALTFSFGNQSKIPGVYSAAFGENVDAGGVKAFAEGQETKAFGTGSHAEGLQTQAFADFSHAAGRETKAYADYSFAQGVGTYTEDTPGQCVVGRYNDSPLLTVFAVGIGSGDDSRKTGFAVDDRGDATLAGTLSQASDRRLKEHIGYLDADAVKFIQALKPAHFKKDGSEHVGFYAQDVEKADKWECMTGEINGYKTLDYTAIIAPLVAYCQSLEKRIEELEGRK